MKTIHAVYEQSVFRPLEAVDLPEGTEVEIRPCAVSIPKSGDEGLDKLYEIMSRRFNSGQHDVAERHNEHQP